MLYTVVTTGVATKLVCRSTDFPKRRKCELFFSGTILDLSTKIQAIERADNILYIAENNRFVYPRTIYVSSYKGLLAMDGQITLYLARTEYIAAEIFIIDL